MDVSVLVTTYNAPRYLELVLTGLALQSVRDFQVVVCDDGSTAETARAIEAFRCTRPPFSLEHVWQSDRGFRAGQARNGGILRSNGAWLVFIDGDMVVHPRFLESHLAAAGPRRILFGGRVKMNEAFSTALTPEQIWSPGIVELHRRWYATGRETEYSAVAEAWSDALSGRLMQRYGGTRRPMLSALGGAARRFLPRRRIWWSCFKSGSNFSTSREVIFATNGFDERFGDGGGEDGELFWRVFNHGADAHSVLLRAIGYHLYHADNWQRIGAQREQARQIERETRASGVVRCPRGLAEHGE